MSVAAEVMANPNSSYELKMNAMRIMYGGQKDSYDYHNTGFVFEFLEDLLIKYHFCDIKRMERFGLFDDTSGMYLEVIYLGS